MAVLCGMPTIQEARLIYIVPVCYVKTGRYGKPSNVIISLHRKKISIITNIPLIISSLIVTIIVTINSLDAAGYLTAYNCPVCQSVTLVHCGQTVAWIKMPLGTEVGLGPGDIVLDGDSGPSPKRGTAALPVFSPCLCGQTVAHLSNC